jgi:hypothetical protein
MYTKAALATVWHVPDDLWSRIAPILGPEKLPGTRGHLASAQGLTGRISHKGSRKV